MQHSLFRNKNKQSGAAVLVFVLLIVTFAATLLVTKLNRSSSQLYRDEVTMKALHKAKDALLGYAVSYPDLPTTTVIEAGPGYMPCSDRNNPPNGSPTTPCGSLAIGRLPWEFIGLDDIRDSAGEQLWYVTSDDFRNIGSGRHFPLNSETPGQLTVDGVNDVVAVIIAPGFSLSGQDRPSNNPSDYLEGENNSSSNGIFVQLLEDETFNDRLLTITRQELMTAVEKRVMGDVAQQLKNYRTNYGLMQKYPFLAEFRNPSASPLINGGALEANVGVIDPETVESESTIFTVSLENGASVINAGIKIDDVIFNRQQRTLGRIIEVNADELTVITASEGRPLNYISGDDLVISRFNQGLSGSSSARGLIPYHEFNEPYFTTFTLDWEIDREAEINPDLLNPVPGVISIRERPDDDCVESDECTNYWKELRDSLKKATSVPYTQPNHEYVCEWVYLDQVDCEKSWVSDYLRFTNPIIDNRITNIEEPILITDRALIDISKWGVEKGDLLNIYQQVNFSTTALPFVINTPEEIVIFSDTAQAASKEKTVVVEGALFPTEISEGDVIVNRANESNGTIAEIRRGINEVSITVDQLIDSNGDIEFSVGDEIAIFYSKFKESDANTVIVDESSLPPELTFDDGYMLLTVDGGYMLQNKTDKSVGRLIEIKRRDDVDKVELTVDYLSGGENNEFKVGDEISFLNRFSQRIISGPNSLEDPNYPSAIDFITTPKKDSADEFTSNLITVSVAREKITGSISDVSEDGLNYTYTLSDDGAFLQENDVIVNTTQNRVGRIQTINTDEVTVSFTVQALYDQNNINFEIGDQFEVRKDYVSSREVRLSVHFNGETSVLGNADGDKIRSVSTDDLPNDAEGSLLTIIDRKGFGVDTEVSIAEFNFESGTEFPGEMSITGQHIDFTNISGTAGAGSRGGQLVDDHFNFSLLSGIEPGDWIENITRGTRGIVTSVTTNSINTSTKGSNTLTFSEGDEYRIYHEFPKWFFYNNWHHLNYVAYARANLPGAASACMPGNDCLRVGTSDDPKKIVAGNDNKDALVISAGSALAEKNQNRAVGTIQHYYEAGNNEVDLELGLEPDLLMFDRGRFDNNKSLFNDQIKIVAPCATEGNEIHDCY